MEVDTITFRKLDVDGTDLGPLTALIVRRDDGTISVEFRDDVSFTNGQSIRAVFLTGEPA